MTDQYGGCRIRAAHVPHGPCPGSAPEFLSEEVITEPDRLRRNTRAMATDDRADPRPLYVPPSSRDRCGWCRVKATEDRPIFPALGTGESYHPECAAEAEASADTEAQPVGADAEPGDLYGPEES